VTTTAYVGWTLPDSEGCVSGHHRSSQPVTVVLELLHTEEVTGSIPVSPTAFMQVRGKIPAWGLGLVIVCHRFVIRIGRHVVAH
jgi:hypothetical protein